MKSGTQIFLVGALLLSSLPAWACLSCNRPLQVSVFAADFWLNVFYMALPLLVVGAVVYRIYKLK
ncbi:hypothetical protein FHS90_003787 [Rufibacter quisquiliarum]|uniref:Uncharacterized protein n=1 Tax=Rufibacter quisquiliarum TaxID=1549639 RepID=A0A839GJK8_9BACT|nr:hypothetical protein [Rufibacter quisquiliarum]